MMVSKHNERHIYESSINGCDWGYFFSLGPRLYSSTLL